MLVLAVCDAEASRAVCWFSHWEEQVAVALNQINYPDLSSLPQ